MLDRTIAYGLDFLFPAGDDAVGASLRRHGEFARAERDLLLSMADADRGGMLDVGANIGALGLPFARARPGWQVVAVEAHRGLAGLHAANAVNNHLYNVDTITSAAGPERGWVDFPSAPLGQNGNFGSMGLGATGVPMVATPVVTLDDVAPCDTRVVKLDVQGYEREALRGAERLLHQTRPAWLVEASGSGGADELIALFTDAGYETFWFWSPFVTYRPLKPGPVTTPIPGDIALVALPAGSTNTWELPRASVGSVRPHHAADLRYLQRYGWTGR